MHWLLTATAAVIVLGALLPGGFPLVATVPSVVTNVSHVPAYALLAYFALAVARPHFPGSTARLCLVVILLSMGLGVGVELVQLAVARSASPIDVGLNLVGILGGVLAWLVWDRRERRDHSLDSG